MSAGLASGADALTVLYPELVRFARGELCDRRRDPQLADDLVQEAALRLVSARIQYGSPRQVRAWMRTTIHRMVIDRVRRPGRDLLNQVGVFSLDQPWARGE